MKKIGIILVLLFLGTAFKGSAQTVAPTDFFAGKWEILIVGTPNGDSKLVTDLSRKDGKLVGELKDPSGQMPEALPLSDVKEEGNILTLFFTAQGNDVNLALEKVDETHLKGSLLNGMFDASAVRIKE